MLLILTTNQERKSNPSTSRHSYRHSLLKDQPTGNTFVFKLFQEHFMESFFHSYKGYVSGFQLQKSWRNWFQDSFSPPPLQFRFYAPSSCIFGFDFFVCAKTMLDIINLIQRIRGWTPIEMDQLLLFSTSAACGSTSHTEQADNCQTSRHRVIKTSSH